MKLKVLSIRLTVGLVMALLLLVLVAGVSYTNMLSGFGSVKSLSPGIGTSWWVIGRSGVGAGPLISMGPGLSTGTYTGAMGSVTLHGTLANMRGFSAASVWFEWGDTPALGNSTPVQNVGAIGVYTASITGFNPNGFYYRFDGSTLDGTSYGTIVKGTAAGIPGWYNILSTVLPIVWLCIVALTIWMLVSIEIPLVLAVVIGAILALVGIAGVQAILSAIRTLWS